MSCTSTPKLDVDVWFDEFVAWQLTVVAPSGNVVPESGAHVTVTRPPSTMSVADGGVYVTAAPLGLFASATMSLTCVSTGAESLTVTWNVLVVALCAASVAVQDTSVVTFAENVLPEAGAQTGVIAPSTLSVACTEYETAAPAGDVAPTVCSVLRREKLPR